jgi:hypothetical protein
MLRFTRQDAGLVSTIRDRDRHLYDPHVLGDLEPDALLNGSVCEGFIYFLKFIIGYNYVHIPIRRSQIEKHVLIERIQ